MLKIKGLKKKKKGKKSKRKEEELFEAAELEEYRKEQQKKQEELGEQQTEPHEQDEEWQKFKQLTSGVDDVLKKTQGDLSRIKSTSYYQKKPPGPSVEPEPEKVVQKAEPEPVGEVKEKKWVGFEEGAQERAEESEAERRVVEEPGPSRPAEEDEEEESEEEEEDDLFDTSYVDALAAGEVKLAYIPESPKEEDPEFDPFDTSIVDKVIDPKDQKRTLVSLGCAVEVLTGKAEKQSEAPTGAKRRRPGPQDLLLGSFDESQPAPRAVEPAPRSILDDDPVFDERTSETLGYAPVTPVDEAVPPPRARVDRDLKDLVDEFVSLPAPEADLRLVEETALEDEFAVLAAESAKKPGRKPPRPAPPGRADLSFEEPDGDDPFDTSFAFKVLPGKFELKLIEKEVLEEHVPIDTTNIVQNKINEVLRKSDLSARPDRGRSETRGDAELHLLTPSQRDLLGGSTTDLSAIGPDPIRPEPPRTQDALYYSDPFDTSAIDVIVAPKKTELKYLEKELLVEPTDRLDDDFDPRAGEIKLPRPDSLDVSCKRASVPKIVAFDVKELAQPDLLAVEQEESSRIAKPLTPYYTDQNLLEENLTGESEIDPFDTSFVTNCPGKVELKLIEKELVGKEELRRSLSDPDFDPRGTVSAVVQAFPPKKEETQDIISEDYTPEAKLHTPVSPRKVDEGLEEDQEEVDPFDTSIVNNLVPGKVEIKFLEKELIESACEPIKPVQSTSVLNLLEKARKQSVDRDLLCQIPDEDTSKPLTPQPINTSDNEDDIDPFDTSCVNNILPGKTEIKLLESELLN